MQQIMCKNWFNVNFQCKIIKNQKYDKVKQQVKNEKESKNRKKKITSNRAGGMANLSINMNLSCKFQCFLSQ